MDDNLPMVFGAQCEECGKAKFLLFTIDEEPWLICAECGYTGSLLELVSTSKEKRILKNNLKVKDSE